MTELPARFLEDKRLRDAARAVLDEDIARLRASLAEQGVASRVSSSVTGTVSGRLRAGAQDVLDEAKQRASDHPGVIAVIVGALLLFVLRGPLAALLLGEEESEAAEQIDQAEDHAGEDAGSRAAEPALVQGEP